MQDRKIAPSMRVRITPGEVLKEEFMVPLGLSANALAKHLDIPTNRISSIVNGTRGITPDTAIKFGEACNTTPEFWMNLQQGYDLAVAQLGRDSTAPIKPLIEAA